MKFLDKYNVWLQSEYIDSVSKDELKNIKDEKDIEDRFYKDLEFGTGGFRGIIAAGSNRMNIYTVGKATQGLANYLNNKYSGDISVSIAYDSRNMSKEFAKVSAKVLCANNISVFLFEDLRPTPVLSYTVRYLKSKAGIVVTASHNPKEYNGYKVYGEDGGQVTDENAAAIFDCIEKIKDFSEVKTLELDLAINRGLLQIIGEEIDKTYFEKAKALTIRDEMVKAKAKELKVIYTPIHGSGNIPVRRVLRELGYENVFVVKEQEAPDGAFPTVAYPNPENPEVFKIALKMAEKIKPDIIFGTDPDCDRIGVLVKTTQEDYKVLSGNQTGILLSHYMISSLKEKNILPENGFIVKTIVTTEMVRKIADQYGIKTIDVLTGFKYIGEKIKEIHETGKGSYIFGFEESYGYLAGDFVRDKDAIIAAMLICEMALYYKCKNMNLYDALQSLYKEYGYFNEKLVSIELKGKEGQEKIENSLQYLRHAMSVGIGNVKIIKKLDYKFGIEKDLVNITETKIDLPASNVLKFLLEDGSWFVVRPSGTEPKMKVYLSVTGNSERDSEEKMISFEKLVMKIIDDACNCYL